VTVIESQPLVDGRPQLSLSTKAARTLARTTKSEPQMSFTTTGAEIRVIPAELSELPPLRGSDDEGVLTALADRFVWREFAPVPSPEPNRFLWGLRAWIGGSNEWYRSNARYQAATGSRVPRSTGGR
jgi:hypothetical protein